MHERLRQTLIKHEGLRLKVYKCPAGKLTIGVGRNLEDTGISESEAMVLLNNDIKRIQFDAEKFTWFSKINEDRKVVILSMIFNMGIGAFKGFKNMIAALEEGNYAEAAQHMMDSLWAKQVGRRAEELARLMRGHDHPTS